MIKNKFRITIAVYNAEKYIPRCLNSLINQTYNNWTAIIVDDASTDNTGKIADEFAKKDSRIRVIHHHHNVGNVAGFLEATYDCEDEDIIVILDGDDFLYKDDALDYLNTVYQDENIWLTIGSYIAKRRSPIYTQHPIEDTRTYRLTEKRYVWHPRTYKYKLFRQIKDEDLRDRDGNYYKVVGDVATILPMIEMAGPNRIKILEKVLYVYNDANPMCDYKLRIAEQRKTAEEIRQKPVYEELE